MRNVTLEEYVPVAGEEYIEEIRQAARPLQEKHVVHINSTYQGGGVAEILNTLVLLLNDVGVLCGWRLLKGSPSFFSITKSFHNGLQGAEIELGEEQKKLYEEVVYHNSVFTHLNNHDAVIVHDPQPLPFIQFLKKRGDQPWVWRCHIDITQPNPALWGYLKQFIEQYDEMIVSDEKYFKSDISIPQSIIHPSIDPLCDKNRDLTGKETEQLLSDLGISGDKPIICQVSRYDIWKDPLGVLEVFALVRKEVDCQLVMLGNVADDDPEAVEMYQKVTEKAKGMPDVHLLVNVKNNDLSVNALQRAAAVVLQKSTKEGFALTVSESLWKETPVVASKVGGIPLQIIEGKNGFLVNDPYDYDGFARRVVYLLQNKKAQGLMGRIGKQHVQENFLVTRHLMDYLELLKRVLKIEKARPKKLSLPFIGKKEMPRRVDRG